MTVIATAGHVDHGKSTLVRRLTGTDPDRWDEERRRGLTIDLGFAELTLPSGRVAHIIDVPGHSRFVKNMLAGVGSVAACIFVVAADEGWKPQSEEHLRIVELVGIEHGVVVLTKASRVDEELLGVARLELADRLAGTPLASWPVVVVDAIDGRGVTDLEAALDALVASLPDARDLGRPRMWVDRSFPISGAGTVLTGTLNGGSISVGDDLVVATRARQLRAKVRALQVFGRKVPTARPGVRVAVNLSGVHHLDVRRGDALIRADQWHATAVVDASLRVLATADRPITRRVAVAVHVGSDELAVRLQVLTGARSIEPGAEGFVRLTLPHPLPLLPGDRYVLRDLGRRATVGGGEVLDVDPQLPIARARPDRSVERVVRERGWVAVDVLERLTGERREPTVGAGVADPEWAETARRSLLERVEAAGDGGLDAALLDDRQRALLPTASELQISHGTIRKAGGADVAERAGPVLAALESSLFEPPGRDELRIEPTLLRDLKQGGLVVESDGLLFSAKAVDEAARLVARLLAQRPGGVTVSEIRSALGTSRKWAMPLIALLDARGVTRRAGDVRLGGPRLPQVER